MLEVLANAEAPLEIEPLLIVSCITEPSAFVALLTMCRGMIHYFIDQYDKYCRKGASVYPYSSKQSSKKRRHHKTPVRVLPVIIKLINLPTLRLH